MAAAVVFVAAAGVAFAEVAASSVAAVAFVAALSPVPAGIVVDSIRLLL